MITVEASEGLETIITILKTAEQVAKAPVYVTSILRDGKLLIRIQSDTHQLAVFDCEFAELVVDVLEWPDADWKEWSPLAAEWAISLRESVNFCRANPIQ